MIALEYYKVLLNKINYGFGIKKVSFATDLNLEINNNIFQLFYT